MRKIWNSIVASLAGIPLDKYLHALAGMLMTALFACVRVLAPFAFVFGLAAGIIKELWDRRSGGSVEYEDIVATYLGALLMQVFIWLYLFIW